MKFEFKNPKAKQSPLYYIISRNRKGHKIRLKYPAGFTIDIKHWNLTKQRVREVKGIPYGSYNDKLKLIEDTAELIFKNNDYFELTPEVVRQKLDAVLNRRNGRKLKGKETDLFKFALELHKNEELRVGEEGAKHLKNSIERLKDFDPHLDWQNINYKLYVDFVNWMNKQTWSKNYCGKQIKNLRKIIGEGFKSDKIDTPVHLTFKTMSEKVYNIYLNEDELTKLYKMKLPKAYERVRDLFLVGCWTGMRVGNFLNIEHRDIDLKKNTISAMVLKGGGKLVLPIHWMLREIIEKYNGLPESVSEQRLNRFIKEICKAAKFNDIVMTEKTISGRKKKIYKEKWEMVTSHTCRRSCITNLHLRGVPLSTIKLISRHETEAQCKEYIKEFLHDEVPQEVMELDFWNNKAVGTKSG